MAVTTKCAACGITIDLAADDCPSVIARGDRFFHQGCIDVPERRYDRGIPAYHIPRSW